MYLGSQLSISDHDGSFDVSRLWNWYSSANKTEELRHLILVAAGTGFTPMPKLLQYFAARNTNAPNWASKSDRTATILIFNKTSKDIIWKELSKELCLIVYVIQNNLQSFIESKNYITCIFTKCSKLDNLKRNFDGGLNQDLKIDVRYILSDQKLTDNKRESTSHDTGVRNYPILY